MIPADGSWVFSLREEEWPDQEGCSSREEAIMQCMDEYNDPGLFFVGRAERISAADLVGTAVHISNIIDDIMDAAYDEVGEVAEGWLSPSTDYEELEKELRGLILDALPEPRFWKVTNVERKEQY